MDKLEKHIVILAYNGVNLLDVSGPAQVFAQANYAASNASLRYRLTIASKAGGLVKSDSGISIDTVSLASARADNIDTLIVAGGGVERVLDDQTVLNWLAAQSIKTPRVGSVCSGAFLLAKTGLLDGRRAVTHWQHVDRLQRLFPNIHVERDPIFICDKNIWTSAGISAGIDLALAMVDEDIGHNTALEVARTMVVYLKRPAGQSQFSALLDIQVKDTVGYFDDLHSWIRCNLKADLSVDVLSQHMNMSPRTFHRSYKKIVGTTPAKAVEMLRVESARQMLEDTALKIYTIAMRCGFNNEERMRRAFLRSLGISPGEYRQRFAAPTIPDAAVNQKLKDQPQ